MKNFPLKIFFQTDDNEAVLVRVDRTNNKSLLGYYKYTKSHTKLGKEYPFELSYLQKLYNGGLIKVEESGN